MAPTPVTTYDQARRVVDLYLGLLPERARGAITTGERGWADAEAFLVPIGTPDDLNPDTDTPYVTTDAPMGLVDRTSGRLRIVLYLDDPDRWDAMTTVQANS